jgi:hypothetical protein
MTVRDTAFDIVCRGVSQRRFVDMGIKICAEAVRAHVAEGFPLGQLAPFIPLHLHVSGLVIGQA